MNTYGPIPTTAKMTPTALRLLRLIAAETGEKAIRGSESALEEEAKRLSLPIRKEASTYGSSSNFQPLEISKAICNSRGCIPKPKRQRHPRRAQGNHP